ILDRPVEELESRPAVPLRLSIGSLIYSSLLGLLIFAGGVAWDPIEEASAHGVSGFRPKPAAGPGPSGGPPGPAARGRGPPRGAAAASPGSPGRRGAAAMTDQILPELLRRESRSFLQYVHESYPWAKGQSEVALRDTILRMADAEAAQTAKLGRMLQRRHIAV